VAMLATLVVVALQRAMAVVLPTTSLPLTAGVVVVAYAAIAWPPVEAAVAAALCGLVIDALSGMPLGVSSFALVVTLLIARLGLRFVTESRGVVASAFAGAFGMLQALVATSSLAAFGEAHGGFDVGGALAIGVLDFALALALFPLLHHVLVSAGLEERSVSLRERLAARL
jgi:rod shape-determining protein MreD